jgi:hypothetical protein
VLPELARKRNWKILSEGTIGELDHSILLRQFNLNTEAEEISPEWRGGRYRLSEHRKDHHQVLSHATEWSSEEAAGRYFAAYRKVLERKWKKLEVTSESATRLAGVGDDGHFRLDWNGTSVRSVEGMKTPDEVETLQAAIN